MNIQKKFIDCIRYTTFIILLVILGVSVVVLQTKQINIKYDDKEFKITTFVKTVEELVNENNIYINENIKISADLNENLYDNMSLEISSIKCYDKIDIEELENNIEIVKAKILNEENIINYEVKTVDNPAIYRGVTVVKTEGKNGLEQVMSFAKYKNDNEVYKEELSNIVKEETVNKVVEVGTLVQPTVSRSNIIIPTVDSGFKLYNISLSEEEQKYAYSLCQEYGLEYELFLAMMFKESGFRASAIGGGNSYGLCQIHISNHTNLKNKLGISNFLDPYDNMKAGAYMLNLYMNSARKFSSDKEFIEVYGLNSYNMGEGSYFNKCYSQGIFHRSYSTSIRDFRDSIIIYGGI